MHADTRHAEHREEGKARLVTVLALTGGYMAIEVAAGIYTGSLALLADAAHLLGDVASVVLALLAIWFASKPATTEKTYGYYRSEILAGLINGVVLVLTALFILYEAYRRLSDPPPVLTVPMLVVGLMGIAVNVASVRLLRKQAAGSLNIKGAYLEVLSDLFASIGVVVASVIMLTTGWYYADPIISGLIGLLILPRTWHLIRECINILMEGAPGHVDLAKLREEMLAVKGVIDVHDIHVWTITSGLDAMSGHVMIDAEAPAEAILAELTRITQDDFGLHHTTIQVELVECKRPRGDSCAR